MKTTTAGADTVLNAPIRGWWGWYFLVNVVIAFAAPYFANEHDRLYSPAIGTYHEVNGRMEPTIEKIWVDGRTAAELHRGHYLFWGLAPVTIQLLVLGILRLLARYRARAALHPHSLPHPSRP